jgi:hypothetical protein
VLSDDSPEPEHATAEHSCQHINHGEKTGPGDTLGPDEMPDRGEKPGSAKNSVDCNIELALILFYLLATRK